MPEGHRKIAQRMTRDFVGKLIAKAAAIRKGKTE